MKTRAERAIIRWGGGVFPCVQYPRLLNTNIQTCIEQLNRRLRRNFVVNSLLIKIIAVIFASCYVRNSSSLSKCFARCEFAQTIECMMNNLFYQHSILKLVLIRPVFISLADHVSEKNEDKYFPVIIFQANFA